MVVFVLDLLGAAALIAAAALWSPIAGLAVAGAALLLFAFDLDRSRGER